MPLFKRKEWKKFAKRPADMEEDEFVFKIHYTGEVFREYE